MSQAGILSIRAAGGGDVVGPSSAIDGDIAVFDGTTGKLIRDSGVHIDPVGTNYGLITISQQAATGTGLVVNNGTNAAAAASLVTLAPLGGDAIVNFNGFTKYQFSSDHADGNFYLSTTTSSNNTHSGTNILEFETFLVNFGKGRMTNFGGMVVSRKPVPANSVFMNNADYYIGVTDTSVPRSITLPTVASLKTGQMFIIKDESGGAATNNITVNNLDAVNIDSATTYIMNVNFASVSILFNGTNFSII